MSLVGATPTFENRFLTQLFIALVDKLPMGKGVDREAPLVLQVKTWAWRLQQRGKGTPLCG